MDDEIADQQHSLQLLDAAAGVRNDDLRGVLQGDGRQVVVDVDLEQLEHPDRQCGRDESKRIGDHQDELFPHRDEEAENNERGRHPQCRFPSMEEKHAGDGEQCDGGIVGQFRGGS